MLLILQRLRDSIRARDWSIVLLELTIVVVGIFLGLRVDAWNQARIDRASEEAYLERLNADIAETLSLLQDERAQLTDWFDVTRSLVEALKNESGGRDAAHLHRAGFLESTRVLIGRAQLATITELVRGGQLALIHDFDVRSAIAASEGLTESRRLQLQVLARQQQVLAAMIRPHYEIVAFADGAWGDVAFEWDEVAGDPSLIRALSQAAENLRVNIIWLDEVAAEIQALESLLLDRTGRAR